jgi:hypothetical protein
MPQIIIIAMSPQVIAVKHVRVIAPGVFRKAFIVPPKTTKFRMAGEESF